MIQLVHFTDTTDGPSAARQALRLIADRGECLSVALATELPVSGSAASATVLKMPDEVYRGTKEPSIWRLKENQHLVLIPDLDRKGKAKGRFAAGTVSGLNDDAVQRVVRVAWQNAQLQRKTEQQQLRMDQYADQVLHDFAELDWMHRLVAQLDVCSLSNSTVRTAGQLLPPLREILHAELIAYVPCDPTDPEGLPIPGSEPPEACQGNWEQLWPQAAQLIRTYATEADSRMVIRNRRVTWEEAQQFPGCDSFILTVVRRNRRLAGWLIAINQNDPISTVSGDTCTRNALHTAGEFSTSEAGLLASAAGVLATHDQNIQLYQDNARRSIAVIRSMANAVDAKDRNTRGHSDRVGRMARHLGHLLSLSSCECEQLLTIGLLHDVGKIGVPDHVLQKPDKLSDTEFDLIKRHTVIGFEILRPVGELEFALPAVLYHHEAFDGCGYPHSLHGDQIPLFARIIAVVDAFDAMTSDRPYRDGMQIQHAERILRNGAGKFWDPQIIELFSGHIDDFESIRLADSDETESLELLTPRSLVVGEDAVTSFLQPWTFASQPSSSSGIDRLHDSLTNIMAELPPSNVDSAREAMVRW